LSFKDGDRRSSVLDKAGLEERDGIKQLTTSAGIKDACDKYMQDAQARDLKDPTLYKFRLLFSSVAGVRRG
jgi:hypothetical protein